MRGYNSNRGRQSKAIMEPRDDNKQTILHICRREMLRPLRDQILRISGFDVEGESGISEAEHLCSEIKTAQPGQLIAFVCNWRVAILTDCPDEIVRTEFDPAAFVEGVRDIVPKH